MKRLLPTASLALGIAAAVVVQGTSSVPDTRRVTVTGCIEPISRQTAIGTAGTLGNSTGSRFVLTTPWAAESSGAPATEKNTVYRLADARGASVSAHEGQKVEVTGTIDQASAQPAESANATRAVRRVPTLAVEEVKKISSSCSR